MNKKGKTTELLPVTKQVDGSMMGIPVIKVTGESGGPTLLLVGGTHGDEPEGVKPILDIVDQLDGADFRGTVIGVPVLNVPAYIARRRGNPFDDWHYDLNRLFPGDSEGSITKRFGHKLMSEILPQADMVITIHSGGNNLYCCKRSIIPRDSENHIRLAKSLGPGWDLIAKAGGVRKEIADLGNIAAQEGKTAITIEIGGACDRLPDRFNENVRAVISAIQNTMKEYNMIEGKPTYAKEYMMMEYEPIRNNHGGLIRFGEACRPRNEVRKGEELFSIIDFFGNCVEVVKAPFDGILLCIPGQVVMPTGGHHVCSIGRIIKRMNS